MITAPLQLKPRLNRLSLQRMAQRHLSAIYASAFKSRLLSLFKYYLLHLLDNFESQELGLEDLYHIEANLEAIDAALIHLWIQIPYNDALSTPTKLPQEQITRLSAIIETSHKLTPYLRLVGDARAA